MRVVNVLVLASSDAIAHCARRERHSFDELNRIRLVVSELHAVVGMSTLNGSSPSGRCPEESLSLGPQKRSLLILSSMMFVCRVSSLTPDCQLL